MQGRAWHRLVQSMSRNAPTRPRASAVQVLSDGGIRIQLHVKPGARASRLTDLSEHALGVQVAPSLTLIASLTA